MKKSGNRSRTSSDRGKGFLVILSAPSGCGKTTILDRLLKRHRDWVRSVSDTTRKPRLGEAHGRDYQFVSLRGFQSLRKRKAFLEWAEIFGQFYGTRKKTTAEGVRAGHTVVLTIDIQGARSVRKALDRKIPQISIFVLPPSIPVLRDRLRKRSTEGPEEIERRIRRAEEEIKAAREYDHTVINRDLGETVHEIEGLVGEFQKKLERRR